MKWSGPRGSLSLARIDSKRLADQLYLKVLRTPAGPLRGTPAAKSEVERIELGGFHSLRSIITASHSCKVPLFAALTRIRPQDCAILLPGPRNSLEQPIAVPSQRASSLHFGWFSLHPGTFWDNFPHKFNLYAEDEG